MSAADARRLLDAYPRIFFACHQRHRRDAASSRTLSAHQASILDHLDAVDPMSLHDLAAHMGVTAGTMSIAIDRLERGGYVVRERAPDDRRRLDLRLTEAGERMKEAGSVLDPARVELLLDQLSPAHRRAALDGLALLAGAAERTMRKFGRGIRTAGAGRQRNATTRRKKT